MISVEFRAIERLKDEKVKQDAAERQMSELVTRLREAENVRHYTLSTADRVKLIREGYAEDLVDNLVFLTKREYQSASATDKKITENYTDKVVAGFTYAAFDPSLYSSPHIASHLQSLTQGCCIYCETFLGVTASGDISHFRPAFFLSNYKGNVRNRDNARSVNQSDVSPYFDLAYSQYNLVYSCRSCSELNKSGRFPVDGERYPSVDLKQEKPLLINPYEENPRDYIRFNPINGAAYCFDSLKRFCFESKGMNISDVENTVWRDPANIPNQFDLTGRSLSLSTVNSDYNKWLENNEDYMGRGYENIHILGLNRHALLLSRMASLNQLRLCHSASEEKSDGHDITHQYRSMAIDAFHTWSSKDPSGGSSKVPSIYKISQLVSKPDSEKMGSSSKVHELADVVDDIVQDNTEALKDSDFPDWLQSSLIYYVPESELQQKSKRRLILLSSRDKIYGGNQKEKCVFLSIDWCRDAKNIIKVAADGHIWETNFLELAASRPMEVNNLFSNNQLWVEGAYDALVS